MNKEEIEIIKLLENCIANDFWYEINNDNATILGSYINSLQQENKQLKEIIKEIKQYNQDNAFEVNTRDYGNLTVVDADELAIFIEKLEKGDSNE